MRKPIWKIIKKHTRSSAVLSPYSRYAIKYPKGEIVKAPADSLGIFCFKTQKRAKEFIRPHAHKNYLFIKVEPIGRGVSPKKINTLYFRLDLQGQLIPGWTLSKNNTENPPEGTICYPAVKVLE